MTAAEPVVVVGGGIVGACVASALATRGRAVLLLEQGDIGSGVSGASLACISTHMMDEDELPMLRWASDAWAAFAADAAPAFEYRRCGQIRFVDTAGELAAAERWVALERSLGARTELRTPAGIREVEPALDGPILAATWSPDDALVNPFLSLRALINAARANGAEIRSHARVSAIDVDGRGVCGVRIGTERVAARTVIVAGGPWSAPLLATAGVVLPLVPRKAQCLATVAQPPVINTVVGACKADGGVDAGYTQIQQAASGQILFNTVFAGGASAGRDPDVVPEIDRAFLRDSVATLLRLFPRLGDIELLRSWVRYEAVTPDDRFLVGRAGPDGLIVAAGDGGTGFVRAPAIGRIVADLLDGSASPFRTDLYDPLRFGAPVHA